MTMRRIAWHKRLAMRLLFGVRISRDGWRWTAPRKRESALAEAFSRAVADAWREDKPASVQRTADGLAISGPKGRIELRWRG